MRLTRKRAIELCIELWKWLAETGKEKEDWPKWAEYEDIDNDCWFCHYQEQQNERYTSTPWNNKDGLCRYCPLSSLGADCQQQGNPYDKWKDAKAPHTRKKYAKLFLEQIRQCK